MRDLFAGTGLFLRAVVVMIPVALVPLLFIGCGSSATLSQASPDSAARTNSPAIGSTTCHYRGSGPNVLPDPACTPGAIDSRITQANIQATICRSGYTATVRPPASYTDQLKRQQMAAYGVSGQGPHGFEEDHLISLELGGAPSDRANLWPEPGPSPNRKDGLENELRRLVCAGKVSLGDAQTAIRTDWTAAYTRYVVG